MIRSHQDHAGYNNDEHCNETLDSIKGADLSVELSDLKKKNSSPQSYVTFHFHIKLWYHANFPSTGRNCQKRTRCVSCPHKHPKYTPACESEVFCDDTVQPRNGFNDVSAHVITIRSLTNAERYMILLAQTIFLTAEVTCGLLLHLDHRRP